MLCWNLWDKMKKVFQYKLVYWIALLINCIFVTLFGFAFYTRVITNSFLETKDFIDSILIFLIALLSTLSLFFLIKKNRYAILTFSATLIIILIIFSYGIFEAIFIAKDFGGVLDYILMPAIYFILFGLLFIIQKYKFKGKVIPLEIEEIGKHKE